MHTLSPAIAARAQRVRFARHSGMEEGYSVARLPDHHTAPWVEGRAPAERKALAILLAAQDAAGHLTMLPRAALKASDQTMHDLFYAGLVNGCGTPDHRGSGNTADSSWWWLTERGEQIARAGAWPIPKHARADAAAMEAAP